jgi:hypothetical protein
VTRDAAARLVTKDKLSEKSIHPRFGADRDQLLSAGRDTMAIPAIEARQPWNLPWY